LMPRTGSKTAENSIPASLAPGAFQDLIPIQVLRSESLPYFVQLQTTSDLVACQWREMIGSQLSPKASFDDGIGFHYQHNQVHYLNACLQEASLIDCLKGIFSEIGLSCAPLPRGIRTRTTQGAAWVFNFGPNTINLGSLNWAGLDNADAQQPILGGTELPPGRLAMLRRVD